MTTAFSNDLIRLMDGAGAQVAFLRHRQGSGSTEEILDIHVEPDHRRKGLGRKLIKKLANWVQEQRRDCLLIWAITRVSNVAAQEFYEACGFRIVGRLHNFYRDRSAMVDGSSGYEHGLLYGVDL